MNKENTDQGSNIEEPLENSGTFINEEESELTAADDPVASEDRKSVV